MVFAFRDRIDAGSQLADMFADFRDAPDVIVLGLPRAGVPVAAEVANALHVPLDVLLVRKIGVPRQPELAMGAIASGDHLILDDDLIAHLGITDEAIHAVIDRERAVLRDRELRYRGEKQTQNFTGKTVILVDDGLATGSTMRVAIQAVQALQAARVMVGIPVGPPDRLEAISALVDRVECVHAPRGFAAVGQFYENFLPTTDDEMIAASSGMLLSE